MKNRENEVNPMPNPHRIKNKPVSIGFLIYLYGPFVIKTGGGFKGTGVPFTLKKWNIDHPESNIPITMKGIEIYRTIFLGKKFGRLRYLSNSRETNTNKETNKKKKMAPTGVRIVLNFFVFVALLYMKFIIFSLNSM